MHYVERVIPITHMILYNNMIQIPFLRHMISIVILLRVSIEEMIFLKVNCREIPEAAYDIISLLLSSLLLPQLLVFSVSS